MQRVRINKLLKRRFDGVSQRIEHGVNLLRRDDERRREAQRRLLSRLRDDSVFQERHGHVLGIFSEKLNPEKPYYGRSRVLKRVLKRV